MDLDKVLSAAESSAVKDKEIDRINNCNDKDYFAILELTVDDLSGLKKAYRKKSLLIHPDKSDNIDAPKAFDKLQRAHTILSIQEETSDDQELQQKIDEKKKLIDIYQFVGNDLPLDTIRERVSDILSKELAEATLEAEREKLKRAKEHEQVENLKLQRELKRELDSKWEDQRESRVENWRKFVKKVDKKKKIKKKKSVLA